MSENLQTEPRDALLREIVAHGIAHGTAEKPIVSRDGIYGTSWVMSFLGVGLREPWLSSASKQLLNQLKEKGFKSRQIATMGGAGSSMLAGCVIHSDGEYNALLVKPEPKAYGSAKQIEGLPDKNESIVIIDDAIGTGFSALKCADILEAAGYEVEGVVCLVRFTYDSGFGLIEERGLKVSALYDLYDDIIPIMQPEYMPDSNPWRARDIRWSDKTAPEGLSPFALVRHYLKEYRESGALSQPPSSLAISGLSSPGGLWISLRDRTTGQSFTRMGTWCFPDEGETSFPAQIAESCWGLSKLLSGHSVDIERCGIGLSLISEQEKCTPADLDNDRFGVLCRSTERTWVIGGALPQMPGIHNTSHQLRHALYTNSNLRYLEEYDLYRHTVTKLIEPGARWPNGGCSMKEHPDLASEEKMASAILERARSLLLGSSTDDGASLFFFNADYLFLSVYDGDTLSACVGTPCQTVESFDWLVSYATQDPRYKGVDPAKAHLQISFLSERWTEQQPPAFTSGKDALGLYVDGVETLLLPGVAIEQNFDAEGFAEALIEKAGASETSQKSWSRFTTKQWLSSPNTTTLVSHPSAWVTNHTLASDSLDRHARGWFKWLSNHVTAGTLPEYELPAQSQVEGAASADLYAEAVRRLRQTAPFLDEDQPELPLDLLPRDPSLMTLAHAYAAVLDDRKEGLAKRLQVKLKTHSARYEPTSVALRSHRSCLR